jgi:hypothetical protein
MRWNNNMARALMSLIIFQCVFLAFFFERIDLTLANNVSINIIVANPSQSEKQSVPVRYVLPVDIGKKDIIDLGVLSVDYDVSASSYYVYGDLVLEPGETRTLKVLISDVWKVPEQEISNMKSILDRKVEAIGNPEQKRATELAASTLKTKLDSILEYQRNNAGDIEARMRMYSINVGRFNDIKKNVFSLDTLKDPESEEDESSLSATLVIEATNVSDESANVPIKYYLPKELMPEHIEDAAGFDIKHDPVLDQFYLYRDLLFAPNQIRLFTIQIKNIWIISEQSVEKYINEASELNKELSRTVFAEEAQALFDSIVVKARIIIESQKSAENVKDYIAAYRANQQRLKQIEDDLDKMRALLDVGQADQTTNVFADMIQSVQLIRLFKELSDKIFKERVNPKFLWKIIMFIVIFVLGLTAFFYGIWTMKLKKEEKKKYEKIK